MNQKIIQEFSEKHKPKSPFPAETIPIPPNSRIANPKKVCYPFFILNRK